MRTVSVELERMTSESFAPFGYVIEAPQVSDPDLEGELTKGWAVPFEADGQAQLLALHTRHGRHQFTRIERHFHVTQAFVAVSGSPSAVAVAPGHLAQPDPADIRAFFIEPPLGYVLNRGVWHSLDRFPLDPRGSTFVMFTDLATTRELREPRETWARTEVLDYGERGLVLALRFPDALGAPTATAPHVT